MKKVSALLLALVFSLTSPVIHASTIVESEEAEAYVSSDDDDNDLPQSIWDIETPFSRIFNLKSKRQLRSKRHVTHTSTIGFRNVYIGASIPADDALDGIKNSLELGVANFIGGEWLMGPTSSLSLGLGFGFCRTGIDRNMMVEKEDGAIFLSPVGEGITGVKSHIQNFHFTIPMMFTQKLLGSFGISLGAEMHLNTYTTAKTQYTESAGKTVKTSIKGLHQKMITPSLVAILGWVDGVGFYLRYNPCNPWKNGYGPDYKSLGLGISLAF